MRINPKIIINTLKANSGSARLTAKELGISPGTVINWKIKAKSHLSRFALITKDLNRKSTKPKSIRQTTLDAYEQDSIAALREETGFCAQKIRSILNVDKHHRTIHRFLKHKGLIKDYGYHRRPRFQDTLHMNTKNVKTIGKLQMDVKYVTPELSGLNHTCYLYALMDIFSRYKEGLMLPLLDQDYSIEAIKVILPSLPFKPDFIQTDNGLEFQGRFKEYCLKEYQLKYHYIHKSNPNENAVIERSFRTDEEEFFFRLNTKPKNIAELNILYQQFLQEYNQTRPHLGLDCKTPFKVINEQKGVQ